MISTGHVKHQFVTNTFVPDGNRFAEVEFRLRTFQTHTNNELEKLIFSFNYSLFHPDLDQGILGWIFDHLPQFYLCQKGAIDSLRLN